MSAEMRGKPVFLFYCHAGNWGVPLIASTFADGQAACKSLGRFMPSRSINAL